jgi:hypothetical protein
MRACAGRPISLSGPPSPPSGWQDPDQIWSFPKLQGDCEKQEEQSTPSLGGDPWPLGGAA